MSKLLFYVIVIIVALVTALLVPRVIGIPSDSWLLGLSIGITLVIVFEIFDQIHRKIYRGESMFSRSGQKKDTKSE